MITMQMYKLLRDRQFGGSEPKQSRHAVGGATVRRIHELLEQGWKVKDIATVLGVTEHAVYYRRNKLKGIVE